MVGVRIARGARSVFDTETRKGDLDFRLYTKEGKIAIGFGKNCVHFAIFLHFVLIFGERCDIITRYVTKTGIGLQIGRAFLPTADELTTYFMGVADFFYAI